MGVRPGRWTWAFFCVEFRNHYLTNQEGYFVFTVFVLQVVK